MHLHAQAYYGIYAQWMQRIFVLVVMNPHQPSEINSNPHQPYTTDTPTPTFPNIEANANNAKAESLS